MPNRRFLEQRLKLHHFRAVDAIMVQRSLLKAAALLNLSQPALTKTLQDMERIIGQRLFDRLPQGMRPTEAGELLAQAARRILAETRRLDEALDQIADPGGGTVALGALPVAAAGVLPGALSRLKHERPGLRVRLQQGRTEELLPLLAADELDLIVGRLYEPALPDGFVREPMWEEPISILARTQHPVFAFPAVTTETLREFELILPTVSQRVGREIDALLILLGLNQLSTLRASSYGFIREMLHATDSIAIMPRLMMAGDLLRGTLRVVPLPVAAPPRPAGLILPRRTTLPPAALAFVEALRAYVRTIGEHGITEVMAPGTDGD